MNHIFSHVHTTSKTLLLVSLLVPASMFGMLSRVGQRLAQRRVCNYLSKIQFSKLSQNKFCCLDLANYQKQLQEKFDRGCFMGIVLGVGGTWYALKKLYIPDNLSDLELLQFKMEHNYYVKKYDYEFLESKYRKLEKNYKKLEQQLQAREDSKCSYRY